MTLDVLASEARATCRKAIGPKRLHQIDELGSIADIPFSVNPVHVHDYLAVMDVSLGWVGERLEKAREVARSTNALGHSSKKRTIGHSLRRNVDRLLEALTSIADLNQFFHEFDAEEVAGYYGVHASDTIRYVSLLVQTMTAEEDSESARLFADLRDVEERVDRHEQIERALLRIECDVPPVEDVLEVALGQRPKRKVRPPDVRNAFPGTRADHFALSRRYLRLLDPNSAVPVEAGHTQLGEACRLATSVFPLLALRTGVLMKRLVDSAIAASPSEVTDLIYDFYLSQAARIQSASDAFDRAAARAAIKDDRLALLESYRTLAEGMLRPFGSLVVSLDALALGQPTPQISKRPLLGDLEDALRGIKNELGELLLLGLQRELRNADAHEDAVISASGELSIVQTDGSLVSVNVEELFKSRGVLQAVLAAIDVSLGISLWEYVEPPAVPPQLKTKASVAVCAFVAAADVTRGIVRDLKIVGEEVTITFDGRPKRAELELLVDLLRPHFPDSIRHVLFRNERGKVLLRKSL